MNARFIDQTATGVQRFARQICEDLGLRRDDLRFVAPNNSDPGARIANHEITRFGKFTGHLWEQIELPAYLRAHGSPLLLNLASTAPAFYPNQVVTHHDITYVRFPSSFTRGFRLLYRLLVPQFLKNSVEVITVSEFSRHEISQHYGVSEAKISVVYNAADARFKPNKGQSNEEPYFLAVSSLNLHKNFKRLLLAYREYAKYGDARLYIIGGSDKAFNSVSYDNESTQIEGVSFLGRVNDEQLIKLYQDAVAFVFPSNYEGFGLPPLEAQQCGCPVIASHTASMPEILQDSAVFVDPNSVEDIASAMTRLVQDSELRMSLREAGIENAERFSWAKSTDLVESIVSRHGTEG